MSESLNYALVALAASAIATTVGSTLSSAVPEVLAGRVSASITESMNRVDGEATAAGTVPGKATIRATMLDPCSLPTTATASR